VRNTIQRGAAAVITAIMLVIALSTGASGQVDPPPSGDVSTQVVGGGQATQLYPGLTAIEYDAPDFFRDDHLTCTATMLEDEQRPGWVQEGLTAAHCVTNMPPTVSQAKALMFSERINGAPIPIPVEKKAYQVRTGSLDRTQVPALSIEKVVVYPGWRWIPGGPAPVEDEEAGDLALFRLSAPVKGRGAVLSTTEPRPGSLVTIAGFGRTSNGSAASPTRAYELRTTVLQKPACAGGDISVRDVCTNNPPVRKGATTGGACNGDSGGQANEKKRGRIELVAVISRGATADCGGSPDVSTSIAPLVPWINGVRTGQIASTLPLTAEQGGPILHPSIKFTTTAPLQRSDLALAG
jgi:hypothetical protein